MFTISYTNVKSLRSNFREVELHLLEVKPDLFLSERSIHNSILLLELTIISYSSPITKHNHLNHHGQRLSAYIKEKFPCGRDRKKNADPDLLYMCFHMALIHNITLIFTLCHLPDVVTLIFN